MPADAVPTPRSNWFPPFAAPTPRSSMGVSDSVTAEASFPAIEQFLDELPSIAGYARESNSNPVGMQGEQRDSNDGAFSMDEWKSLDLEELAALGLRSSARGNGQTESGRGVAGMQAREEIASTLDYIAARIRRGDLTLEKFRRVHPEVAMAISLATLFRHKP